MSSPGIADTRAPAARSRPVVAALASLPDRLAGAPLDLLKLAAVVLMVGDHVDTILLNGSLPELWRLGRIAFPLFCLVAACHLARGSEPGRYAATLLLIGIVTQPVYAVAFPYGGTEASILFTLAAGAVLGPALATIGPWRHAVLASGLALVLVVPRIAQTGVDFGLAGVMLPAVLFLALRRPWPDALWLLALVPALNAFGWQPRGEPRALSIALDTATVLIGTGVLVAAAAAARGRPRFLPRYALHLFYPGHLAVLAVLRALGVGIPP